MIRGDAMEETQAYGHRPQPWQVLLRLPQTWGAIVAKALTDPVLFFVADWFPIYLVAKGFSLKSGILAVWVPFIAADLGNFFGGALPLDT
jgi:MFS transporter, ACS family, hexuronate transporter